MLVKVLKRVKNMGKKKNYKKINKELTGKRQGGGIWKKISKSEEYEEKQQE